MTGQPATARRRPLGEGIKPLYLARTWTHCDGPPDMAPFEEFGAALEFRRRFRRGFVERWPDRAVWDESKGHWTPGVPR